MKTIDEIFVYVRKLFSKLEQVNLNEIIQWQESAGSFQDMIKKDFFKAAYNLANKIPNHISWWTGKDKTIYYDETELFKLELKDSINIIYALKYWDKNDDRIYCSFFGIKSAFLSWSISRESYTKDVINKAKNCGLHYLHKEYGALSYVEYDNESLPHNNIIHPEAESIYSDVQSFMENPGLLAAKYNLPRIRKGVLTGPPGTGKSSIIYEIIRRWRDKVLIAICESPDILMSHIIECDRNNKKTIAICEDFETYLQYPDNTFLNFLDGLLQPPLERGGYIVFTSNKPKDIAFSVRRPGRIDRIWNIGPLINDQALLCARLYFGDYISIEEKYTFLFNGKTGAEIKAIAHSAILYASSKNLKF